MTTTNTLSSRTASLRPTLSSPQARNPFASIPLPRPVERGQRASDLFKPRPLDRHLERNAGWLQALPRTSDEIEEALFPEFLLGGMRPEDVRSNLNAALWDKGYTPDREEGDNPTWTWHQGY